MKDREDPDPPNYSRMIFYELSKIHMIEMQILYQTVFRKVDGYIEKNGTRPHPRQKAASIRREVFFLAR